MSGLRNRFRCTFFGVADKIALATRRRQGGGLLLVRLDLIGDFVGWLECARRLRTHYAGQRITVAVHVSCVDLARALPFWDEVVPVDVGRFIRIRHAFSRWRMLRSLRARGFDQVIHPVHARSFLSGDSLVRATDAPEIIGSAGDTSNITPFFKAWSDNWYTRLLPTGRQSDPELTRSAGFLAALGVAEGADAPLPLPVLAGSEFPIEAGRPYFVVFPGASRAGRCWPADRFAELVRHIVDATGWLPVLCGTGVDMAACEAIAGAAGVATRNLAGQTRLTQVVELIRGASLLVGNESSAVHIAASVGTPSVAIVGGGHFGRFLPYPAGAAVEAPVPVHREMPCFNCNWLCSQPHEAGAAYPCVAGVPVSGVLNKVLEVVGPRHRPGRDINLAAGVSS